MLTVGQLAKTCDVRTDTVRDYERIGMIGEASRTDAGYRKFDESATERIRFIKNAQALGFSLEEIRRLLDLRSDGAGDCSGVRALAEAKISDLERQIGQMRLLKRELEKLVDDCPGDGVPLESCTILASLISSQKPKK
jgi:DNA-binding transcriptional MerR regulator